MSDTLYGFVITRQGFNLIAKWGAGAPRILTDVMVGSGRPSDGDSFVEYEDLIQPVALATSTVPVAVDQQIQFVLEYNNSLNGGLQTGFWLNEYGVFAQDPDLGRILLLYGSLGDFPEWVAPYTSGLVSRRYPVTIGVGSDGEIIIQYPAIAFITAADLETHNTSPVAHENRFGLVNTELANLLAAISDLTSKVSALTGLDVTGAVDTFALLPTSPVPANGTIFVVREDETRGGITALYEVINGVWEFLGPFSFAAAGIEFSDVDVPAPGTKLHFRVMEWAIPDPGPPDPEE